MTLAVTISAVVLILGLGLLGALRDLPRGIVVLAGLLFGALLVDFWATPLARDLSERLGNPDLALLRRFVSISIFSAVIVVLGFGSGMLLPTIRGSTVPTRLVGALIGLFSGALVAGFLLTYANIENPPFLIQVQASVIGRPLLEQLPMLLAAGAGVLGAAVIIAGLLRLVGGNRSVPQPPPKATPLPAKPAAPAAPPRPVEKVISDKIDQRLR